MTGAPSPSPRLVLRVSAVCLFPRPSFYNRRAQEVRRCSSGQAALGSSQTRRERGITGPITVGRSEAQVSGPWKWPREGGGSCRNEPLVWGTGLCLRWGWGWRDLQLVTRNCLRSGAEGAPHPAGRVGRVRWEACRNTADCLEPKPPVRTGRKLGKEGVRSGQNTNRNHKISELCTVSFKHIYC